MNFIKIDVIQESGDHKFKGIELIRIKDIRKVFMDMSENKTIYIDYYNHNRKEVRKLVEQFDSVPMCIKRMNELLIILNS